MMVPMCIPCHEATEYCQTWYYAQPLTSIVNQSAKVKESTRMFKTFRASREIAILCLLFALVLSSTPIDGQRRQAGGPQQPSAKDSDPLKPLQWRSIGPYRAGRVTAVAGVASQPSVFYFGATGGGVWKTSDGGI